MEEEAGTLTPGLPAVDPRRLGSESLWVRLILRRTLAERQLLRGVVQKPQKKPVKLHV